MLGRGAGAVEDALHADGGGCRGEGAPAAALCVKAAGELALLHHQVHNESSFSAKTNNCSRICFSGC